VSTPIHYVGSVRPGDGGWTVRVDLTFVENVDARAFGQWLHMAIKDKIESEGGKLFAIAEKKPVLMVKTS
jgi:hypothetical protein